MESRRSAVAARLRSLPKILCSPWGMLFPQPDCEGQAVCDPAWVWGRRLADARVCKAHSSNTEANGPGGKARGAVESGFSGSPSFVAVVQSTDLRHRHDGPHLRRLNRSWLR